MPTEKMSAHRGAFRLRLFRLWLFRLRLFRLRLFCLRRRRIETCNLKAHSPSIH